MNELPISSTTIFFFSKIPFQLFVCIGGLELVARLVLQNPNMQKHLDKRSGHFPGSSSTTGDLCFPACAERSRPGIKRWLGSGDGQGRILGNLLVLFLGSRI